MTPISRHHQPVRRLRPVRPVPQRRLRIRRTIMLSHEPSMQSRHVAALVLATVTALAGLSAQAHAAAGDLDPSFGTGGIARTSFTGASSAPNDVARSPGGKLVAVGRAAGGFPSPLSTLSSSCAPAGGWTASLPAEVDALSAGGRGSKPPTSPSPGQGASWWPSVRAASAAVASSPSVLAGIAAQRNGRVVGGGFATPAGRPELAIVRWRRNGRG